MLCRFVASYCEVAAAGDRSLFQQAQYRWVTALNLGIHSSSHLLLHDHPEARDHAFLEAQVVWCYLVVPCQQIHPVVIQPIWFVLIHVNSGMSLLSLTAHDAKIS